MNKLTIAVLTTLMLGTSLSALADDSMKGMDMSKMPMSSNSGSMNEADKGKFTMRPTTGGKVVIAHGVIASIDAKAEMIALSHLAIPKLKSHAMTMDFKVADPKLLVGLTVGQSVNFRLKDVDGKEIVVGIVPMPPTK